MLFQSPIPPITTFLRADRSSPGSLRGQASRWWSRGSSGIERAEKMGDPLDALRPLLASHSPPLHALVVPSEDNHQVIAASSSRPALLLLLLPVRQFFSCVTAAEDVTMRGPRRSCSKAYAVDYMNFPCFFITEMRCIYLCNNFSFFGN